MSCWGTKPNHVNHSHVSYVKRRVRRKKMWVPKRNGGGNSASWSGTSHIWWKILSLVLFYANLWYLIMDYGTPCQLVILFVNLWMLCQLVSVLNELHFVDTPGPGYLNVGCLLIRQLGHFTKIVKTPSLM